MLVHKVFQVDCASKLNNVNTPFLYLPDEHNESWQREVPLFQYSNHLCHSLVYH